jgi:hypothetical protein
VASTQPQYKSGLALRVIRFLRMTPESSNVSICAEVQYGMLVMSIIFDHDVKYSYVRLQNFLAMEK